MMQCNEFVCLMRWAMTKYSIISTIWWTMYQLNWYINLLHLMIVEYIALKSTTLIIIHKLGHIWFAYWPIFTEVNICFKRALWFIDKSQQRPDPHIQRINHIQYTGTFHITPPKAAVGHPSAPSNPSCRVCSINPSGISQVSPCRLSSTWQNNIQINIYEHSITSHLIAQATKLIEQRQNFGSDVHRSWQGTSPLVRDQGF